MAGIPILKPESIGSLSVLGSVIALAPSRINLGGRQYVTTTSLQVTMTGLTANTLYYLYVTLVGGVPSLSISTAVNSVGPGATLWKLVGAFYAASATTLGSFVSIHTVPTTNWLPYTPTISNFGPAGSISVNAFYRRSGISLEVHGDFLQTVNFSSSTGQIGVNIIGNLGLAIATSNLATNTTGFRHIDGVAFAVGYNQGESHLGRIELNFSSTTDVRFLGDDGSTAWNTGTSVPIAWAVSTLNSIRYNAIMPITGWSNTPLKDL